MKGPVHSPARASPLWQLSSSRTAAQPGIQAVATKKNQNFWIDAAMQAIPTSCMAAYRYCLILEVNDNFVLHLELANACVAARYVGNTTYRQVYTIYVASGSYFHSQTLAAAAAASLICVTVLCNIKGTIAPDSDREKSNDEVCGAEVTLCCV